MGATVKAVYENGVFRPLEPVDLEEGQIVQVPIPAEEAELPQHRRIKALLAQWNSEPDEESPEWWDEFHRFLKENRLNFPERDLGLSDDE